MVSDSLKCSVSKSPSYSFMGKAGLLKLLKADMEELDDDDDEVALFLSSLAFSSVVLSSSVFTLKAVAELEAEEEAGGCCKTDCKISDFTTVFAVVVDVTFGFLLACSAAEKGEGMG